jgi:hypothetical protein
MYTIEISDDLWKTIFTFLGALLWPLVVIVAICIFKKPIAHLIRHIRKLEAPGCKLEIDDTVDVLNPKDKLYYSVPLQLPSVPTVKVIEEEKVTRLSDEEIEQSRQRALDRIKEDTERVGYQRGKPYQLPNGKWAVAWELELSAKIGITDSLK